MIPKAEALDPVHWRLLQRIQESGGKVKSEPREPASHQGWDIRNLINGSLSRPVLMTGQVLTSTLNGKTEGYSLWAHSLQENERKEKLEPVNFPG